VKPIRLLRRLLPYVLSLAFLVILYARTDWTSFLDSLGEIDLYWLGAMIITSLAVSVLRGIRWGVLCRWEHGGAGPVKALFISRAGNNLLPLRIGDLVRIQYAKDRGGVSYGAGTSGVFLELVIDLGVLSVLGLVFCFTTGTFLVIAVIALCIMAMLGAGLFYLHGRKDTPGKVGGGLFSALMLRFADRLRGLTFSRSLVHGLLLTIPVWAATLLSTYAGFRLFLPHVSLIGLFGGLVLIFFSATIPSAPGFIGTYHAAVGAAIIMMGYQFAEYAALPVVLHMTQYLVQTVVGLMFGFGYIFRNDWSRTREAILSLRTQTRT